MGLDAFGLSFHVGSQQMIADQWGVAIERSAHVVRGLAEQGLMVRSLNIGGGYPAHYRVDVPALEEIGAVVHQAMKDYLGDFAISMVAEPGRSIVAEAGIIESEVVLISGKKFIDGRRWVYLDVGKFGGLAETMDECIQYDIVVPKRDGEGGPVVVAGPTCDSADIMYETARYDLPLSLEVGDRVRLLATGAYTTTYSSIGFNGFPPLKAYFRLGRKRGPVIQLPQAADHGEQQGTVETAGEGRVRVHQRSDVVAVDDVGRHVSLGDQGRAGADPVDE